MIGTVLQFPDLQELCAPGKKPRRARVEKWARERGLKYSYDAAGGIWTTLDALNAALGLNSANDGEAYLTDDVLP